MFPQIPHIFSEPDYHVLELPTTPGGPDQRFNHDSVEEELGHRTAGQFDPSSGCGFLSTGLLPEPKLPTPETPLSPSNLVSLLTDRVRLAGHSRDISCA